jgi:hypothetical protein
MDARRQRPASSDDTAQSPSAAVVVLVTEFEFVAGLIPYYRRLEITALAGTGLILSGLLAAWAAMVSEGPVDARTERAFGVVLSLAAWGPAMMTLVQLMALVRLRRASSYIREHLQGLAKIVTGTSGLLLWESAPTDWLGNVPRRSLLLRLSVSSIPITLAIAIPAVLLPLVGAWFGAEPWAVGAGAVAGGLALAAGVSGANETIRHELRHGHETGDTRTAHGTPTAPGARRFL